MVIETNSRCGRLIEARILRGQLVGDSASGEGAKRITG
jgi:hypothetical protein